VHFFLLVVECYLGLLFLGFRLLFLLFFLFRSHFYVLLFVLRFLISSILFFLSRSVASITVLGLLGFLLLVF